jgi:hypothetical protein
VYLESKKREWVVHTAFWQPENGSVVLAIATIDKENQSYQHLIWFADRKVFVTQGCKQKIFISLLNNKLFDRRPRNRFGLLFNV